MFRFRSLFFSISTSHLLATRLLARKSMKYCLICCRKTEFKLFHVFQKMQAISLLHFLFIEYSTELFRGKILDV